jgi:hypothetical protein
VGFDFLCKFCLKYFSLKEDLIEIWFNLLAPEFYIQILAHSVCKIWIIQEPKKVTLWNKRHFEEKNGECAACLKYTVLTFVEKINKMHHLEGSGTPVPYIGRTVLKVKEKNVYLSYGKYQSFFSDFKETRIIWTNIIKILKYQISWKSLHWEPSCSSRTDGRTEKYDEVNRHFSQPGQRT